MSETKSPQPFSDNFWSSSSNMIPASISIFSKQKEDDTTLNKLLESVDEAPDFYDPYSDLNLYLSKRIKQEMQHCGSSKKWSVKIQEELLEKISPEFRSKFPQYRLGISALKKTWEKISYYTQQFEQKKEALTESGRLNTHFFIRENLKNYTLQKHTLQFHPSHFAHQLASKMSECIAAINAERSKPNELAQLIWSVQRHLLTNSNPHTGKSPYDEYGKIDKLIVKTLLEITAKDPQIGHEELKHKVKDALHALSDLPSFSSMDKISANVSALVAERLYASSPFHSLYFSEQKNALQHFIRRHSSLCKSAAPMPQLGELMRRIMALYTLACGLDKAIEETAFKNAVLASYPVAQIERPKLPQSIYAFIAAELILMRSEEFCRSPAFVADAIWQAYKEAVLLPPLEGDFLEIAIWKSLSDTEHLLEKLPYRIGLKIEEEIANICIDNPHHSFSALVHAAVQFFKRTKELVSAKKSCDLERKIENWAIQGEMLCRWIQLPTDTPLFRLICTLWKEHPQPGAHTAFVAEICKQYLVLHPELTPFAKQLNVRVWILYKFAWYTHFSKKEESSYERFLQWHALHFAATTPHLSKEHVLHQLQEIVNKNLPLIPFDAKHVASLLLANEQVCTQ